MPAVTPAVTQSGRTTLRRLLTAPVLSDAEVVAGLDGLDLPVLGVTEGTSVRFAGSVRESTLLVFSRTNLAAESIDMDVVIRLAFSSRLAGLVVQRPPGTLPLATARLADKFCVPLIVVDHVEPQTMLGPLDELIHAPRLEAAALLAAAVDALRRTRNDDVEQVIATVQAVLGGRLALLDGEGRHVHGDHTVRATLDRTAMLAHLQREHSAAWRDESEALLVLGQPVRLSPSAPTNFWLVAVLDDAGALVADATAAVVAVASWMFAAYLSNQALTFEREGRERALLLGEILEHRDNPGRHLLERATGLGWQLSGWHTGVEVGVGRRSRAVDTTLVLPTVKSALAKQGFTGEVIDRPSGWVLWVSRDTEPTVAEVSKLTRRVRDALLTVEREIDGLRLCAGIGNHHQGTAGLHATLSEAHQAGLLARVQDVGAAVEHIDVLGLRRFLVDWFSSESLREAATALVEPVHQLDPTGTLLTTLACYLDHESSATDTAAVLGVHRNTVLERLDRIRKVLPVDISRPDERLAVHLATRVVSIAPPRA